MLTSLRYDGGATWKVNHGADTSLDNLVVCTFMAWIRLNTEGPNSMIFRKGTASADLKLFKVDDSGALQIAVNRTGSNLFVRGDLTNYPGFALNKWVFVVGRLKTGGTSAEQQCLLGGLSHPVVEPSSYIIQQVGSGGTGDNAGDDMIAGNDDADAGAFDGSIAWGGIWNRYLSMAEISDQWNRPHLTPGNVLFTYYGRGGIGLQEDLSGLGNHGVRTGALPMDGPPIPYYWMARRRIAASPAVACVAGTDKRRSSMFPLPGLVALPCPDGTISALDRRQVQWMFPIIGIVSRTIITDLDSLIQKQDQLLTTSLEGAIQAPGLTETVSLAALIQLAGITISTDLDAKLQAVAILRTTDLDAAIQSPNLLRTVLLDAILKATVQLTVSTDAVLQVIGVTKTTDLDAALALVGELKTLSMDAAVQLANLTVTTDLDAKLKALAITSITDLDAVLKATGLTETVLLDAILKALGVTRTASLDGALALLGITSITDLDAILKIVGALETTSLDGLLQLLDQTVTTDLDATLIAQFTKTTDLDAVLQALGVLKTTNLDAAIQLAGATRITDIDAALLLENVTINTALDGLLLAGGITVTTDIDAVVIEGLAAQLIATSLDAHLGFAPAELGIKPSWLGSVGQRMWTKYYAPFRDLDTFPPIVPSLPSVSTASTQVDALLQQPGSTLSATVDALIQIAAVQQTALLDSVLSLTPATRIEITSLDAALGLVALTLGTALDGSIEAIGQLKTATLDGLLSLQPLLNVGLEGSLLLEDLTLSASLDASLQSGTTPAAPSNLVATEL